MSTRQMLIRAAVVAVFTMGGIATAATPAADSQRSRGKQVFDRWCYQCHGPGDQAPGTMALAAKYKDGSVPAMLEERSDLQKDLVKHFVRNGVSIMPFFRKTEISDSELNDLSGYLDKTGR